ncbi:hypothetical protein BKA70DRAFT_1421819 [Coprinopsis sp. MPI-PUGE-AT-0042]|nr:hypothetical protein BKA70DRAFT_1421819 [Coprinopsis sp. MPI-PUGE-AT-0042]
MAAFTPVANLDFFNLMQFPGPASGAVRFFVVPSGQCHRVQILTHGAAPAHANPLPHSNLSTRIVWVGHDAWLAVVTTVYDPEDELELLDLLA